MEEIIITVPLNGPVKIEVDGVVGTGCKALTEGLEKKLGKVTKDEVKPEYYEQAAHNINIAER